MAVHSTSFPSTFAAATANDAVILFFRRNSMLEMARFNVVVQKFQNYCVQWSDVSPSKRPFGFDNCRTKVDFIFSAELRNFNGIFLAFMNWNLYRLRLNFWIEPTNLRFLQLFWIFFGAPSASMIFVTHFYILMSLFFSTAARRQSGSVCLLQQKGNIDRGFVELDSNQRSELH